MQFANFYYSYLLIRTYRPLAFNIYNQADRGSCNQALEAMTYPASFPGDTLSLLATVNRKAWNCAQATTPRHTVNRNRFPPGIIKQIPTDDIHFSDNALLYYATLLNWKSIWQVKPWSGKHLLDIHGLVHGLRQHVYYLIQIRIFIERHFHTLRQDRMRFLECKINRISSCLIFYLQGVPESTHGSLSRCTEGRRSDFVSDSIWSILAYHQSRSRENPYS
jgi:hypothetical protein